MTHTMSGDAAAPLREIVRFDAVRKVYGGPKSSVAALDGVDTGLRQGTFTAVMGPSGSGKSTFLQCAAGLDMPTSGTVRLDGVDLSTLSERALTRLRRARVGFVFQAYNLLPALSVVDNVTLPLRLAGRRARRADVDAVLRQVGLDGRRRSLPGELSGGQQQRVAIARALVARPAVLFADEPTGALDSRTAQEVLALLRQAVRQEGQTVVLVTHDPVAAAHADRVLFLSDGRLVGALDRPSADRVAERMAHLDSWSGEPVGVRGEVR